MLSANTLPPAVPTKHSSNIKKPIIVFNGWLFLYQLLSEMSDDKL